MNAAQAHVVISDFAGGKSEDYETVDRVLEERGAAFARVLEVPPPNASKRQSLANGAPLQLRGKPQAIPRETAREIVKLSDDLQLDEEACIELWARVTDRRARRRLAERSGLAATSLDGDLLGAAKLLWYVDVESSLEALYAALRGAFDARLDARKRRLLFGHTRRLARGGLVEALCGGIRHLSGALWARKDRRRRAAPLATTAAACLFFAFYELQMTGAEAKLMLDATLELSRLVDELDDWHARKLRARETTRAQLMYGQFAQAQAAAHAAASPVTTHPMVPHAGKLRACRDVLLLALVQALDPRAELRGRADDPADDRLVMAGDGDECTADKLAALGPAFPNKLAGDAAESSEREPLERALDAAVDAETRGARAVAAVALAACALSVPRDPAGRLAPEARRRLAKALASDQGACCQFLATRLTLATGVLASGLRDAMVALMEVVATLTAFIVEAVVLEPPESPLDVVDILPELVDLVANVSDRYPAFADLAFAMEDDDALFSRLVMRLEALAKRAPSVGLVPYFRLLVAATRGSPTRAARVRDVPFYEYDGQPGLTLRELFDKLKRYCSLLEDGERRYEEHLKAAQSATATASNGDVPLALGGGARGVVQLAAAEPDHHHRRHHHHQKPAVVAPVWLPPQDADILKGVVELVGGLCAPSADHVENLCLTVGPDVGVDPFEALAHLAHALFVLYLRDSDAVPLDLKGECMRSLAALCVHPGAARDIAAMWEKALVADASNSADDAALPLEPPPEHIIVARERDALPPVFAWPASWRAVRQPSRKGVLYGETSSGGISPLQVHEHRLHTVLGGQDARRGSPDDVARVVGTSPSAIPTVFSPANVACRAELDLVAESRLRSYAATEGVLRLGRELVRRESELSGASRVALVKFASRSVLLRCAAPPRARKGVFRRRDDRWRLAARACDLLAAIVSDYGPSSADWKRDFSEADAEAPVSAGGGPGAQQQPFDFAFGGGGQVPPQPVIMPPKSAARETTTGGGGGGVSAGFAAVFDALTSSGGLLRILCELVASARAEDEADDDDEKPTLPLSEAAAAEHRLTKTAGDLAAAALVKGLATSVADALKDAREKGDARVVERCEAAAQRGAGVSWWRAKSELLALELLTAIADVEVDFVAACRAASRSERASSRAAKVIVSSASGPPSTLATLATSLGAPHRRGENGGALAIQEVPSPPLSPTSPFGDRPAYGLATLLADTSNDIVEIPFFAARGSALLVELAKRVAPMPRRERHSALAIGLLRRIATAAAAEGEPGKLRAALVCFAEEDDASTRADFAARIRDPDEGDDDDDDVRVGVTNDAADLAPRDAARRTPGKEDDGEPRGARDLALLLLADTTPPGAERHSVGHWLLGLDETASAYVSRRSAADDRGCLAALVDLAFGWIAKWRDATFEVPTDDDDDDDDAAAASRLGRQCRVAERAVDLLYKLAKARGTRGGVVEAVAAAMGGLALPTLVVTARRLARAAVANPDEAAALASVARAALDLATVAAHAAKLPDVDLSDRARDRARTMIFHRFLRPADRDALRRRRARKRVAGSLELDAVSALFSSALEASEAALATAADLKDHQQPVRRAREQAAEDLEKITSKIVERRAASVDLAVSVSRLAVVALGYACEAASLLAPRLPARPDQPPWDDMDDDDDDEDDRDDPDPKRLVASVAIAALEALLERRDADAAAADAAAHAVADACANLRMLAAGDSATGTNDHLSRDLEAIAALVGAALLEREAASQGTTSGILSAAAASEVYRGHLHVALAHVLGSRNYFRSGEPSKRRRRLLPAGNDDDDDADDDAAATNGGGVEYAEVYAVSEAAWTRVCVDAASASTPWVRLGAASALSAAASGAACRDDAFFDDFLRGAGFLTFSSNRDGSSFLPGSVETRRAARYHHEPSEHLVVQSIETTLAALLRLGSRRTGAHALAKSSVVEVIARDDRVWTPPDEARPRCLCLALEVVRQLLRQLPAHASLRQQSQDLVYARDRVLSRVLLDDARARPLTLAAFRARAAYVGVLASLAASARDDHRRARRAAAVVEDARRASMLWSLLGAAATQAPYAPLPPWPDAHPAPWRDDDASWWRDVRPAPASEENLRASMPTTSPSSAAHSNWTAFDDDKLRCCVATWARLVDFARHQVALPEFDLDALVATLRKAAAIRRGTLCDADTLAAHELRATADFALEASLLALRDRLCPPETATIAPPGAPQDPDQPRAADPRTERRLHAAAVLAALDLVTFTDDDDFVSRLKKRLTTVLSLDV